MQCGPALTASRRLTRLHSDARARGRCGADGSDTLTGSWPGRFDDDSVVHGTPVSFDAVLTELGSILHGEVVEPNTFRKDAGDTLLAVLSGTRDGTSVTFVKTYTDFDDADHPR